MKQLPCIKQNVLGYWKTNTESQPIIAIISFRDISPRLVH